MFVVSDSSFALTCTQDRVYPSEYEGHFSRILITREEIVERAEALAKLINNDFKGKRPVLLCVLKGANPVRIIALHSYGKKKE